MTIGCDQRDWVSALIFSADALCVSLVYRMIDRYRFVSFVLKLIKIFS